MKSTRGLPKVARQACVWLCLTPVSPCLRLLLGKRLNSGRSSEKWKRKSEKEKVRRFKILQVEIDYYTAMFLLSSLLQWLSTSLSMTVGKGRFGTSWCGRPFLQAKESSCAFTLKSGMLVSTVLWKMWVISQSGVNKRHICARLLGLEDSLKGKESSGDSDELMSRGEKH